MRNSEWRRGLTASLFSVCCLAGLTAAAPQGDDGAARLRAAIRSATAQVRELQDQNAILMAKQSEAERERLALTQQLAASEKELMSLRMQLQAGQTAAQAAQAVSAQQAAQLTAQIEAQKQGLASAIDVYRDNLTKWQTAYNEAAAAARTRDADAKNLDALLVQTRGRATACEEKNAELFKFGKELIAGYGRQNILTAFGGSEPFTRLKQVEIENMMQDYEDKLRANVIAHPAK